MAAYSDKTGEYVCKKFGQMESERHNWNRHWDEVAEYVVPRKDNIYGESNKGEKKENLLFDNTSVYANELLASALHGMLTNPATIWFGLETGEDELDNDDEVRKWLQDSVKKIINVMNQSNFQTEIHETYIDLGGFGTTLLRVLEDDETVVRFESRPIYEAYILENFRGVVDTVYYKYEMEAQQIYEQFGEKSFKYVFGDQWKKILNDTPLKPECMIHAVEPNKKYKGIPAPGNLAFASMHIHKGTKKTLEVKGYHENPNIVSRWSKISGEKYGRGPGMKTLADIKMLNKMKKATIEGAQLAVNPILQAPDDGVLLPIKTGPNTINYYRAGTQDRIEALNTGNRVDLGEIMMENVRKQILQGFFIDQLQLVQQDRMTTTEVLQRKDEQLRLLGPILGRQHFELLKPLVDRVFGIMFRKGLLEEAPRKLRGRELQVKYTSQIAKAQKTAEADNITRGMAFITPFVPSMPEILDNFHPDKIVEYAGEAFGFPEKILRKKTEREQIRDGRRQAQEEAANLEKAGAESEVVKNMAQVETA